jgi:HPt (histidine-containing phosphotransfer) domain-containing protein
MSDVLDRDALIESIDGDMEFLAETVEIFDEDGPELISRMREATAAGDCAGLATAAHTYKGMVGNFCAAKAQQAALTLEMMGKNADLSDAAEAVAALEVQADLLRTALAELLGGGGA